MTNNTYLNSVKLQKPIIFLISVFVFTVSLFATNVQTAHGLAFIGDFNMTPTTGPSGFSASISIITDVPVYGCEVRRPGQNIREGQFFGFNSDFFSGTMTNITQSGPYIFGCWETWANYSNAYNVIGNGQRVITVTGSNNPPTANAGLNRSITLPINSVVQTGASASDSDGTYTINWTKVSGPAGGTIVNQTNANPTFNNLNAGTYTFRMTVTDNDGATDTDDMNVTVNSAPVGTYFNISPTTIDEGQSATLNWRCPNFVAGNIVTEIEVSGAPGGFTTFLTNGGVADSESITFPSAGTYNLTGECIGTNPFIETQFLGFATIVVNPVAGPGLPLTRVGTGNINLGDPLTYSWDCEAPYENLGVITATGPSNQVADTGVFGSLQTWVPPSAGTWTLALQCDNFSPPESIDYGSFTVTVNSVPAAPFVDLGGATPVTSGNDVVLTWNATNATACYGNGVGGFNGSVGLNGPVNLGALPANTYTFGIYCDGPGGRYPSSGYDFRTISVTSAPPQCNDGIDNDGDGFIDHPTDAGCTGPTDNTEDTTGDGICAPGENFSLSSSQTNPGACNNSGWQSNFANELLNDWAQGQGVSGADFTQMYNAMTAFYSQTLNPDGGSPPTFANIAGSNASIGWSGFLQSGNVLDGSYCTANLSLSCPAGGAPVIDISPTSLPFGDTEVGTPTTLDFTIRNTGGGTLVIDANPSITPDNADSVGAFTCISASCGSVQNITSTDAPVPYTIQYNPSVVSNGQGAQLDLTGTFSRSVTFTGNGITASSYCWDITASYFVLTDGACGAFGTRDGPGPSPAACDEAGELGNVYEQGCYGGGPDNLYDYTCSNTCAPPTPTSAYFTTPNAQFSDQTITIDSGDSTTLEWTSSGADANGCELREVAGGTGTIWSGELATGNKTVTPATDTTYSIRCQNSSGWSPNSFDVTVTVNPPTPPNITFNVTSNNVNDGETVSLSWNVTNATQCYGNGEEGFTTGPKGLIGGYTTGPLSFGASPYNFGLNCENNGVWSPQPDGSYEIRTVTVNAPPPATGNFTGGNGCPIAIGDSTCPGDVSWDAENTTTPVVENTTTGGIVANTEDGSGEPVTLTEGNNLLELRNGATVLHTITLTASCASGSSWDSVGGTCAALSNLSGSVPSQSPSATFDPVTGNYTFVSITVFIENIAAAIPGSFDVIVDVDRDGPGPLPFSDPFNYTLIGMGAPDSNTQNHSFNDIPFGGVADVRVRIDDYPGVGSVPESDETDNQIIVPLGAGVPNINMDLDLDPSDLVRGGGTVTIDYDTNASFPMDCTLSGPALTTHTFDPSVDGPTPSPPLTTGPISTKSQYTLVCEVPDPVDPVSNPPIATFTDSASVETTGFVEEI